MNEWAVGRLKNRESPSASSLHPWIWNTYSSMRSLTRFPRMIQSPASDRGKPLVSIHKHSSNNCVTSKFSAVFQSRRSRSQTRCSVSTQLWRWQVILKDQGTILCSLRYRLCPPACLTWCFIPNGSQDTPQTSFVPPLSRYSSTRKHCSPDDLNT